MGRKRLGKDCEYGKAVVPADLGEMLGLGDASLREGCRHSSDPLTMSSLQIKRRKMT